MVGDKNGLFDENLSQERLAQPEGNEFKFEMAVSTELYMQGNATNFIVYGTETKNGEGDETYYAYTKEFTCFTIKDTGWDVLGEIHTKNSLRGIFPKKYLNIYDYKWFDKLRDQMYGFLDGETNF
ncbi:MAG: hypothetical protein ACERKN_10920 [Velocimicrobium sp.]